MTVPSSNSSGMLGGSQPSGCDSSLEGAASLLRFIEERRLSAVAIICLELYRPLVGIGDCLFLMAQPMLRLLAIPQGMLECLRSREQIDWLITQLENNPGRSKK